MNSLDLPRARVIVDQAENAFANSAPRNPYQPFADAGAQSRLEAIQAILLMLAEYYQHAKHDHAKLADFNHYSRLSSFMVMRIKYDSGAAEEEQSTLGKTESVDSFVRFIGSLEDHEQDYWPSVYERLDLQPISETGTSMAAPTKPWWKVW